VLSGAHPKLSASQIRHQLTDIARQYGNRECFACAEALALTRFFELLDQFLQTENQSMWLTKVKPDLMAA